MPETTADRIYEAFKAHGPYGPNPLRDMADHAAAVVAWRSIDSAPRDGTWILGWASIDSAPYRISWGRNHRDVLAWCTQFGSFAEGYMTHWMPLEAPL